MKVVIVNCFDTYEDRIDLINEFFTNKGHIVTIIQSDFRHFKKIKRVENKQNFIFIESKPYYRNMSFARLYSHYTFAKKAFDFAEKIKPDLLYAIVPPNSIAKYAADYKKKHKNIKLIFDLIDLWPETMPINKIKFLPPFTIWRLMRDTNLKYGNFVITECELYRSILQKVLSNIRSETLYLAKKEIEVESHVALSNSEVNLCYLGSINSIIDIKKIKQLMECLQKIIPTTLHIIGDGESKDILINEIKSTDASVKYYGKIYDPQEKQDIFDKCHFGLNIMKDNVCVGLTMKSIDYFQHGLLIINNIKADTAKIVEQYNIGFNITDDNVEEVAYNIANIDAEKFAKMKENVYKVFIDMFSPNAFEKKFNYVINEVLSDIDT